MTRLSLSCRCYALGITVCPAGVCWSSNKVITCSISHGKHHTELYKTISLDFVTPLPQAVDIATASSSIDNMVKGDDDA